VGAETEIVVVLTLFLPSFAVAVAVTT
jgi:hypothetical protein